MQPYEVVDVQTLSDERPCRVTSLKILPDGRLIVVDAGNKCVKLFDTKHKLIDKLQLLGDMWDITVVGDDQVLVTANIGVGLRQLQVVIVSGRKLRLGHSFQTENLYNCTVYFEDELFVVDSTDVTTCIKVLDMTGKILRTIDKSPDWLRRLAVSPANRVLYVSNLHECPVKCMTFDGEVLAEFQGARGFNPAVHPDDSVYVCNFRCIHHITSQCTHIETILDHGELYNTKDICINPSGNRLYVSECNGCRVKVFRLGD